MSLTPLEYPLTVKSAVVLEGLRGESKRRSASDADSSYEPALLSRETSLPASLPQIEIKCLAQLRQLKSDSTLFTVDQASWPPQTLHHHCTNLSLSCVQRKAPAVAITLAVMLLFGQMISTWFNVSHL